MVKRIKILVATGLFPPEVGGPATYSKTLVEELPRRGFGVDILPFREVRSWPKVLRHILNCRTSHVRQKSVSKKKK